MSTFLISYGANKCGIINITLIILNSINRLFLILIKYASRKKVFYQPKISATA